MSKERELYQSIICKFIANLPRQQIQDSNRMSYQAEKAFYYYIDEILKMKENKDIERIRNQFFFKLKEYSPPSLRINHMQLIAKLQQNKPVCGALIFNKENTKILVIRVRNKFGFPKGKWNQNETAEQCAARQVQEETGVYIHNKIDTRIKIEFETHGGSSYFFVARGIGEDERLKIDKKEIDDIMWMRIQDIRNGIGKFVQRSRIVWEKYQKLSQQKSMSVNEFIEKYGCKQQQVKVVDVNPFLTFSLNRHKLLQALRCE